MTDLFQHPIEREARRAWAERQEGFPAFVRQRWEDGTWLARMTALRDAAVRLGLLEAE